MELRGCPGCSGFSYTQKYKQSIVDFSKWIYDNAELGMIKYQDMYNLIEVNGGCKGSETRMIVPFMIKGSIINRASCEWHGSKVHAISTKNLFTKSGECFIQFLRVELERNEIQNEEAKSLVQQIYEKFSKIQFYYLFKSNNLIYREMVKFLLEYKTMDEMEFYMLSTAMQDNTMETLGDIIRSYRNQEYTNAEFKVAYNVNAYSYTSKILIQYNLFQQINDSIVLNPKYELYFIALVEDKLEVEESKNE